MRLSTATTLEIQVLAAAAVGVLTTAISEWVDNDGVDDQTTLVDNVFRALGSLQWSPVVPLSSAEHGHG